MNAQTIKHTKLIVVHVLLALLIGASSVIPANAGSKPLGANVRITRTDEANIPDVVVVGSTAYAVWEDYRDVWDEAEVYLAKSTDGGATWGTHVNVGRGIGNEIGIHDPAVAASPDGTVYVTWYNPYSSNSVAELFFTRSTDGGANFDTPLRTGTPGSDFAPSVAADPDGQHVYLGISVVGSGGYNIGVRASTNRGAPGAWGAWRAVNDFNGSAVSSALLDIAAGADALYVVWEDQRSGYTRIYGDRSTDQGQSFGADFAISPTGAAATNPVIAVAPNGVVYVAFVANDQVWLTKSTDQGQNWSAPLRVSNTGELELGGWDMAVDGNGSIVVLWAAGNWGIGVSDLMLSTSIDGGRSFTILQMEDNQGEFPDVSGQFSPAIAAAGTGDNARAVMVWEDTRNTGSEIWAARAEIDATPPTAPTNLRATPGDTVVDLVWEAASDRNGIAAYYVARAPTPEGPYTLINGLPLTTLSYRDVGLTSGVYYYIVFAMDGTSNLGPASNTAQASVTAGVDLPGSGTIAYVRNDQVYLNDLPALASERFVAAGLWPQFAANGQGVYYRSGDMIVENNLAGTNPQIYFAHDELFGEFEVDRGNSIYFAWLQQHRYTQINPYEVWDVFEPHFGTAANSQFVDAYEFAASPTIGGGRTRLAYTSVGYHATGQAPGTYADHSALCIADLATGNRLTTHATANYQEPAFAPDGERIAFAADYTGQYEIWTARVQADGGLADQRQVTRGPAGVESRAPAWSSDGAWLIFQRDVETGGGEDLRLFSVRADGSSLRALAISGSDPAWHVSAAPATPTPGQTPTTTATPTTIATPTPVSTPPATPVGTPTETAQQSVYLPMINRPAVTQQ